MKNSSMVSGLPRSFLVVAAVALSFSVAGCRERPKGAIEMPAGSVPASPGAQAEGRLEAALAITDSIKRDNALASVALAAGTEGDAATTKRAVLEMRDIIKKDNACAAAALALAQIGKRSEAAGIARLMADMIKRDEALSRLAGE